MCHIKSAPYRPAWNALAGHFVQSLKQSLKATLNDGRSLTQRLSSYLLSYRTTPHTTTGVAPCTLLLNRDLCTRFNLLCPDRERFVTDNQSSTEVVSRLTYTLKSLAGLRLSHDAQCSSWSRLDCWHSGGST